MPENTKDRTYSHDEAKDIGLICSIVFNENINSIQGADFTRGIDRVVNLAFKFLKQYPTHTNWEKHKDKAEGRDFDEEVINYFTKQL
ncbi:MAG: hypothetical protein ACI9DM_000235 [Cyclobacteriaceae bacterium]|jgi:hypothetical protein